jgi:hypothetical protein
MLATSGICAVASAIMTVLPDGQFALTSAQPCYRSPAKRNTAVSLAPVTPAALFKMSKVVK